MRDSFTNRPRGPVRRVRTLVADDEPLARELLSNLVRRDATLELIGAAATGSEALAAIEAAAPELVLLDIQMPCLDGISVAEQLLSMDEPPYVVFVTAHDSFALQAFELAVRDYLVKPVSKKRFAGAIARARHSILGGPRPEHGPEPIVVRNGDELVSLMPADIVWVAAANQYVELHTVDSGKYVVSQSLRQFGRGLADRSLLRIHRSTLVNRRHVVSVVKSDGRYRVRMSDGSTHDVARNRKPLIANLLASARENART